MPVRPGLDAQGLTRRLPRGGPPNTHGPLSRIKRAALGLVATERSASHPCWFPLLRSGGRRSLVWLLSAPVALLFSSHTPQALIGHHLLSRLNPQETAARGPRLESASCLPGTHVSLVAGAGGPSAREARHNWRGRREEDRAATGSAVRARARLGRLQSC